MLHGSFGFKSAASAASKSFCHLLYPSSLTKRAIQPDEAGSAESTVESKDITERMTCEMKPRPFYRLYYILLYVGLRGRGAAL